MSDLLTVICGLLGGLVLEVRQGQEQEQEQEQEQGTGEGDETGAESGEIRGGVGAS